MSATDELRRMLDERGVEHYDGTESTLWGYEDYNEYTGIYRFSADETSDGYMQVRLWRVTPEQAVASTLGRGMLTADDVRDLIERHSDASGGNGRDFHNGAYMAIADELNATLGLCNCSNSERTDAPSLPYWWTHDGTLHVELPKLPESISVRLPDQRDREVHSARVWQYTRDSGTCHDEGDPGDFCCSECGVRMFTDTSDTYTMIAADERTIIKRPNYCPNCGRKVVDE